MPRTLIVVALAALAACSGGGRISIQQAPEDDAGADAGVDASSDAPAGDAQANACGPAPYVSVGLVVRGATIADSKGAPLPDARFTSPLCPGLARTSGMDGTLAGVLSKSTPFYGRLEHMGYVPLLTPELSFDADVSDVNVSMPPEIVAQFIPGFGPGLATIVVGAMKGNGKDACASLDGISFAVEGHPEANIQYFSTDTIPQPTGGTETTTAGRASISGIAPGPPVKITATKTGCSVDMAKPPQTGKAPLEADFLSIIAAYLNDAQ